MFHYLLLKQNSNPPFLPFQNNEIPFILFILHFRIKMIGIFEVHTFSHFLHFVLFLLEQECTPFEEVIVSFLLVLYLYFV